MTQPPTGPKTQWPMIIYDCLVVNNQGPRHAQEFLPACRPGGPPNSVNLPATQTNTTRPPARCIDQGFKTLAEINKSRKPAAIFEACKQKIKK